jgi:hypothetical protein
LEQFCKLFSTSVVHFKHISKARCKRLSNFVLNKSVLKTFYSRRVLRITVYFPNYLHNLLFSTYAFRPYLGHHQCFNDYVLTLHITPHPYMCTGHCHFH